jgi:hypothetical protein
MVWKALTLGEAIWGGWSVPWAIGGVHRRAYLGGDEGRETALLHEAHLDGYRSVSINCTLSA